MTDTSEHLRQSLVDASREAEALRLNAGTSGNISVRTDRGMLITPTGVPSKSLRNEMIVEMDLDRLVEAVLALLAPAATGEGQR